MYLIDTSTIASSGSPTYLHTRDLELIFSLPYTFSHSDEFLHE